MFGLLASIVDGVLIGSVYGMAAIGLTLIFGVMNVANLTHGTMIVAGMFALVLISDWLGISPYAVMPSVAVIGFGGGVLIYWLSVHRMIGRPPLMSLLSTFAINLVLIGLGTDLWDANLFNVQVSLPGLSYHGYTFPGTHLMAAALTGVIAVLLFLFLQEDALRQGDPRRFRQSRGGGTGRHPDHAGAGARLRPRRRDRLHLGRAHRHHVSLHLAVG